MAARWEGADSTSPEGTNCLMELFPWKIGRGRDDASPGAPLGEGRRAIGSALNSWGRPYRGVTSYVKISVAIRFGREKALYEDGMCTCKLDLKNG